MYIRDFAGDLNNDSGIDSVSLISGERFARQF
jgi:hypothetical protein